MKQIKWAVFVAALGLIGYAVWIAASNPAQLTDALARVGWLGFLGLCAVSLLNYLIRYWRWRLFMREQQQTFAVVDGFICYLSGFALITTPGKIGEAVRGIFFKERHDVPVSCTFSGLIGERVTDLLAGVLISGVGFIFFKNLWWLCLISLSICALIVVAIFHSELIERLSRSLLKWMPGMLARAVMPMIEGLPVFFANARQILRPRIFFYALLMALLAWAVEGLGFAWLSHRLDVNVDIVLLCSVFTLSLIAGIATPGGVGSTEAAMAFFLIALGATPAAALVIALVCRFATLWFAIVLGLLALLYVMRGRSLNNNFMEISNG